MAKNWYLILIAYWKMLNIGDIKKCKSLEIGGHLVLVNYQSLLSNFLLFSPQIISFSIKYIRNRLLLESSGIGFYDLPACNKITKILAIATSQIIHLCNMYHVFALQNFMSRFNSGNFYQYRSKIKLFLPKKYKIFEPWGLHPHTPNIALHCRFLVTRLIRLRLNLTQYSTLGYANHFLGDTLGL